MRDLRADDRDGWGEVWAGYLAYYQKDLPPEGTSALWDRLTGPAPHPQMFGLGAFAPDGRLLGLAHCIVGPSTWDTADDCYLEDLAVAEDARGRGVGRALIGELVRRAGERGWRRVFWVTEESNARARRLYDSVGSLTDYVQYEVRLEP
ncbi:GNAT family N-acetyltransferase [Motilibacter peucedani]|uniref:GNAT family N-acetyltransferase n=1 Tax=Motilibacter peucedani TaxID=598650 RepID=UPI001E3D57F5|nr:GNAT family N-acetyltransferase [Motilibacter peucedani]